MNIKLRIQISVIFLAMAGFIGFSLSCQNQYAAPPLSSSATSSSPPTSTPTVAGPTATSTICPLLLTATPGPPSTTTGIYWYNAQINGTASYSAGVTYFSLSGIVFLTVNGATEGTDSVTAMGPGVTLTLGYAGVSHYDGYAYSCYNCPLTQVALQPGASYTMTTATSIGTASATLTAPGWAGISVDGSAASWTGPSGFNQVFTYQTAPAYTYDSIPALCASANSPFSIPASAYPSAGVTYTAEVGRFNSTTAITNGTGNFSINAFWETQIPK